MSIKSTVKKFIPYFLLDFYYWLWAFGGAVISGFPSRELTVIGITGTSGKTTTTDFITRILEQAGNKVASISTARFKIGDKEWKNNLKMSMPGRFKIQKFLRQAVNEGCKYLVLEVTSEGIRQHRHEFINFKTAVFTNLSPEHIESHGGFENYRNAKLKLFKAVKNIHIINIDDKNADYFWQIPAKEKYSYGIKNQQAKLRAEKIENLNGVTKFFVNDTEFKLNLLGEFNVYNALAAIAVGLKERISLDVCKKALEKATTIPGRMEIIVSEPFKVVVDYAHTPEQLENVYKTLTKNYKLQTTNYKLICVLGSCGGGRDKWKRPVLGKIAGQYCKEIIITNEDPYDEDPSQILSEIKSGISNSKFLISNFYEILDRREAIKKALEMAKPGEVVIITGKGSEPWMCLANGKKIPWSDKETVKELLRIKSIPENEMNSQNKHKIIDNN